MSNKSEVSAKLKDSDSGMSVHYNFGETLDETRQLFGDDVVHNAATKSMVIDLQSLIRRSIKAGKTQEEVNSAVAEWKPGIKTINRMSATDKIANLFNSMTPEQKAETLRQLAQQRNAQTQESESA